LAEDVNRVAVRGLKHADVATTRAVLLSIIENLARDEQAANMRMPSTRELAQLVTGKRNRRAHKHIRSGASR
jgi:hypothetical protein